MFVYLEVEDREGIPGKDGISWAKALSPKREWTAWVILSSLGWHSTWHTVDCSRIITQRMIEWMDRWMNVLDCRVYVELGKRYVDLAIKIFHTICKVQNALRNYWKICTREWNDWIISSKIWVFLLPNESSFHSPFMRQIHSYTVQSVIQ